MAKAAAKGRARPKAMAKAKAKAKAVAKAKAAGRAPGGRARARLRRPAGCEEEAVPQDPVASWDAGEVVDFWKLPLEKLGRGTQVVLEECTYFHNACKASGQVTGIEIEEAEVWVRMKMMGTSSEALLRLQSGQPSLVMKVHRCQPGCNQAAVGENIIHCTRARRLQEVEKDEGWTRNLEKAAVVDPEDELRQLREAAEALAPGMTGAGKNAGEKAGEEKKDSKEKKKKDKKRAKTSKKKKEKEKSKEKKKEVKEASESNESEDSCLDGRSSKMAAIKDPQFELEQQRRGRVRGGSPLYPVQPGEVDSGSIPWSTYVPSIGPNANGIVPGNGCRRPGGPDATGSGSILPPTFGSPPSRPRSKRTTDVEHRDRSLDQGETSSCVRPFGPALEKWRGHSERIALVRVATDGSAGSRRAGNSRSGRVGFGTAVGLHGHEDHAPSEPAGWKSSRRKESRKGKRRSGREALGQKRKRRQEQDREEGGSQDRVKKAKHKRERAGAEAGAKEAPMDEETGAGARAPRDERLGFDDDERREEVGSQVKSLLEMPAFKPEERVGHFGRVSHLSNEGSFSEANSQFFEGAATSEVFPPTPPTLMAKQPDNSSCAMPKEKVAASLDGCRLCSFGTILLHQLLEVLPLRSKTTGTRNPSAIFPVPSSRVLLDRSVGPLDDDVMSWLLCMILALNSLWGEELHSDKPLNDGQLQCVGLLAKEAKRFCEMDVKLESLEWDDFFKCRGVDYRGEEVKVARRFQLGKH
eukprot:Skav220419  [mRNA]  locus=scaffold639:667492:669747:+ [translate_table: standard]